MPVVNLDGVAPGELMLDGPTLANIFLGEIKSWDDAAIKKLNPKVKLPSPPIAVVHRSDGSGTTFNFTNYLSKVSADWKTKVGEDTAVEWPVGIGAKGNEGVANTVANTKGAIGYVEYAYAKQNKMTYAKMVNKDGKTVAPDVEAFQAAAANADWANAPSFYQILTDQPGAKSWPITAATFILVHKQPQDAAATTEALKFFDWAFANGAKMRRRARLYSDARHVVGLIKKTWATEIKTADGKTVLRRQITPEHVRAGAVAFSPVRRKDEGIRWSDASMGSKTRIAAHDRLRDRVLRRVRTGRQRYSASSPRPARSRCSCCSAASSSRWPMGLRRPCRTFGFGFLTSQAWNPVTENFGALPAIYGTLVTSLIAMLIAVPVGLGIAVFLTELCPHALRRPIGVAIELLAGIPSIIYGIWGLFVLAPFLQATVQPALIAAFADVPVLSTLFAGPPYGIGIADGRASFSPSWSCRSSPRSRATCSRPCRRCSRKPPSASAAPAGK